jgi:hypothetical protein
MDEMCFIIAIVDGWLLSENQIKDVLLKSKSKVFNVDETWTKENG